MSQTRRELIECHNCKGGVSVDAVTCPHCGSRHPGGPYVISPKELRRNDHILAVATLACGAVGVLYGLVWSFDIKSAIIGGLVYGLIGLMTGVPIGFGVIVAPSVIGKSRPSTRDDGARRP